jgi:hypothetical protein
MGELAEDFTFIKEQKTRERQTKEPKRMEYALRQLRDAGHIADAMDHQTINVVEHGITLWVYSGWWAGKGIGSGRGIHDLLKKLKQYEITLCSKCMCMTHTIGNKCGKCKEDKYTT